MSTIKSVFSGGGMIDIHLDNGNILMLDCEVLLQQTDFSDLREDDRILYPRTDGSVVYWRDGPCMTLPQILEMM